MDVFAAGSPYQSLGDALGRGVVDQALLSEAQRGVLASVITAVKREGSAIGPASCHDIAAIWIAFFLKMPAASLLTGVRGRRRGTRKSWRRYQRRK